MLRPICFDSKCKQLKITVNSLQLKITANSFLDICALCIWAFSSYIWPMVVVGFLIVVHKMDEWFCLVSHPSISQGNYGTFTSAIAVWLACMSSNSCKWCVTFMKGKLHFPPPCLGALTLYMHPVFPERGSLASHPVIYKTWHNNGVPFSPSWKQWKMNRNMHDDLFCIITTRTPIP